MYDTSDSTTTEQNLAWEEGESPAELSYRLFIYIHRIGKLNVLTIVGTLLESFQEQFLQQI